MKKLTIEEFMNKAQKYDFYMPKYNVLIEYNGLQHYKHVDYWHKNGQTLKKQQYRDSIKKKYALSHGYRFLVIKYNDKNIEEILSKNLIFNQL